MGKGRRGPIRETSDLRSENHTACERGRIGFNRERSFPSCLMIRIN